MNGDDVAATPQASGSGPIQRPTLAELLRAVPSPKKGGEEARIGGFWAVRADEYPMTETLTLWKSELLGIHCQVAVSVDDGPVYAVPFGWSTLVPEREVLDEYDEVIGMDEARTDYVVGVQLVHEDGSTCGWSLELVPSWIVGPLAEGKERSDHE